MVEKSNQSADAAPVSVTTDPALDTKSNAATKKSKELESVAGRDESVLAESRLTEPEPAEAVVNKLRPKEHGGPKGLEPTRYGDWEKNGRCTDF